jgi:hypothetical protein
MYRYPLPPSGFFSVERPYPYHLYSSFTHKGLTLATLLILTMAAPSPHQLWQERQGLSTLPSTCAPAPTTPYQQNHFEVTMTTWSPCNMPTAVSCPPNSYDFNSTMDLLPIQQLYGMDHQPSSRPAACPNNTSETPALVPLVTDAYNALPSVAHSPTKIPSLPTPPYSDVCVPDTNESPQVTFFTPVDCFVRAIQSKTSQPQHQAPAPDSAGNNKSRKRYQCSMLGCHKSFFQKTHLEIHTRAHTGVRPFVSNSSLMISTAN